MLSLGLGIGANTAIFGLLNAVLLERLPVSHPERLVSLQWTAGTTKMVDRLTYAEYTGLKQAPGMPALAASTGNSVALLLAAAGAAASIIPGRRAARIDPVEDLRAD